MKGLAAMLFFITHTSRGSRARKWVASMSVAWFGAKIVPRIARSRSASGNSTRKIPTAAV